MAAAEMKNHDIGENINFGGFRVSRARYQNC